MDSNDWSTINAGRDQALGREMEQLRRRYREHLDMLSKLAQSAPTEQLARRYEELKVEVTGAIERLNELERGGPSPRQTAPGTMPVAPASGTVPAVAASATPPPPPSPHTARAWDAIPAQPGTDPYSPAPPADRSGVRAIAIVAIGAVVLAILGVLGWRALSHRGESGKVVEEQPVATEQPKIIPSDTTGTIVPPGSAPVTAAGLLAVKPASQDYGTVKKGTRVVKKFEVANKSDSPVTLVISRSECHCLWFDFQSKLAAGAKTPLTVSLDGARAKKGPVNETVTVSTKEHPDEKSSFTLTANVQ